MYQSVSWHVYEKLTLKLAYAITAGEISRTAKDNFRSGYWDKKKNGKQDLHDNFKSYPKI